MTRGQMPKPPASGKKPKEKGPALITDQSLLGGAATTEAGMPRKRFYRQRAHANPLSIHHLEYPESPALMNWSTHYPTYFASPDEPPSSALASTSTLATTTTPLPTDRVIPAKLALGKQVEFADIGCGFGGLLISLAPLYPDTLMLGLEIRTQVTQYVSDKIRALRVNPGSIDPDNPTETNQFGLRSTKPVELPTPAESIVTENAEAEVEGPPAKKQKTGKKQKNVEVEAQPEEGVQVWEGINRDLLPPDDYAYGNVGVLRGNAMKFLPNFFEKGQLSKIFFLFPDPHFKARKHKARIISPTLCAEYAHVLKVGGLLYTITDVPDLHTWMISHLAPFPLFHRLTEGEIDNLGAAGQPGLDGEGVVGIESCELSNAREKAVMEAVKRRTEEGKKVERNGVGKQWSVWRRLADDEVDVDIVAEA